MTFAQEIFVLYCFTYNFYEPKRILSSIFWTKSTWGMTEIFYHQNILKTITFEVVGGWNCSQKLEFNYLSCWVVVVVVVDVWIRKNSITTAILKSVEVWVELGNFYGFWHNWNHYPNLRYSLKFAGVAWYRISTTPWQRRWTSPTPCRSQETVAGAQ